MSAGRGALIGPDDGWSTVGVSILAQAQERGINIHPSRRKMTKDILEKKCFIYD
jgi:hypothetical protein